MLTLACFVLLLVLALAMVRSSAAGPLAAAERLYLVATPIPAVLVLVLPGVMGSREWGMWLTEVGGWLSVVLIVVGVLLLGRRSIRGEGWDRRLLVGLFVAALPVLLVGIVALMYALN